MAVCAAGVSRVKESVDVRLFNTVGIQGNGAMGDEAVSEGLAHAWEKWSCVNAVISSGSVIWILRTGSQMAVRFGEEGLSS